MTAIEILKNMQGQLQSTKADLEREELNIRGRVEQIDVTLANLRYALEHHLDKTDEPA